MIALPPDLLGRDFDFGETTVEAAAVRRYAEMVGDAETLANAGTTVPPTFCLTLHRGMRPEVPLPAGYFGVYGGHDLEFLEPLRIGQTYRSGARVADVYEKSGRTGVMTVIAREGWIQTAAGAPAVRIVERQIVRRQPETPHHPTPAPEVHDSPVLSLPLGPQSIELGTDLGPFQRAATRVEQVARYVEDGEMREGLFIDPGYARSLGYRGIVVPGPMLTAFLEHFLRAQLPGWRLERLGTTFRLPTITGDSLSLSGAVSEHHLDSGGEHIVCDLVIEHPSGERAVTAAARLGRMRD